MWRSYLEPSRGGLNGWKRERRVAWLHFGFRTCSQSADTGRLFSVHYFAPFNKLVNLFSHNFPAYKTGICK